MTRTIEELWISLRREAAGAQRRVDAQHPLDLYADFEQPDMPGLVLFTAGRPPDAPTFRAIKVGSRQRQDGRWSLRISLAEPRLFTVFSELCRDIVEFTRTGVDPANAAGSVLVRLDRWRTLMQAAPGSLNRAQLRGLIGELLVMETVLLPEFGPDEAVAAWTGPMGSSQDFRLPTGLLIEVKALDHLATEVRINGLRQLDGGNNPLQLALVRLQDTGRDAEGALTAADIVARLKSALAQAPVAQTRFEELLRFAGWDDANDAVEVVVRLDAIERLDVGSEFPRLILSAVPAGVVAASYTIALPREGSAA